MTQHDVTSLEVLYLCVSSFGSVNVPLLVFVKTREIV